MREQARAAAGSLVCRILGSLLAHRIVCAIGHRRRRPIELSRELLASPSAIVNQLKIMKAAGLVKWHSTGIRRKGRVVEYWLADPGLLRLCQLSYEVIRKARASHDL